VVRHHRAIDGRLGGEPGRAPHPEPRALAGGEGRPFRESSRPEIHPFVHESIGGVRIEAGVLDETGTPPKDASQPTPVSHGGWARASVGCIQATTMAGYGLEIDAIDLAHPRPCASTCVRCPIDLANRGDAMSETKDFLRRTFGPASPPVQPTPAADAMPTANGGAPVTWIFGYGSLIWRPGFAATEARDGYIEGYARRFWQASPDHRGTPEAPGRVVTLVTAPGARCWGRAYRLAPDAAPDTLAALDHREQAGYVRDTMTVRDGAGRVFATALVYRATAEGPWFIGPAPRDEMARHIARSSGPSGPNRDYLLALDRALAAMGVTDEHVVELAAAVRSLAGG